MTFGHHVVKTKIKNSHPAVLRLSRPSVAASGGIFQNLRSGH